MKFTLFLDKPNCLIEFLGEIFLIAMSIACVLFVGLIVNAHWQEICQAWEAGL